MPRHDIEPPMRVSLPAEVRRPDTIIGPYTARQAIILASTGLLIWLLWAATANRLPLPGFAGLAAVLGIAGYAIATLRRDGVGLDRWLLAAITHGRSPKNLVSGGEHINAAPQWIATTAKVALPAPFRMPAKAIADSLIDLGPDGHAALVGCGTVNLLLRSHSEQNALIGGFARWLNALDAPAQILIRSQRVDLRPMAAALTATAGSLRDPELENAARAHAAFLHRLCQDRELLHRQVTVIVRDKRSPVHAQHRAIEAAQALAGCDISTQILDGATIAARLADSVGAPAAIGSADAVTTGSLA